MRPTWDFSGLPFYYDRTFSFKKAAEARKKALQSKGRKVRILRVKYKVARGKDKGKTLTKYITYERR